MMLIFLCNKFVSKPMDKHTLFCVYTDIVCKCLHDTTWIPCNNADNVHVFRFVRAHMQVIEVCCSVSQTHRALDEEKVRSHSPWRYHLLQEVMTSGCCVIFHRNTSHTVSLSHAHRALRLARQAADDQIVSSIWQIIASPSARGTIYYRHLHR